MKRLYRHIKELLTEFLTVIQDIFYDSYSGLKKKRLAIVTSVGAGAVLLVVVFIRVVPNGELAHVVTEGVITTVETILPQTVAQNIKEVIGQAEYNMFEYPTQSQVEVEVATKRENPGVVIHYDKPEKEVAAEDWVWEGSWGPPVSGDIESTEGEKTSEAEKDKGKSYKDKTSTATEYTSRYSWRTPVELHNITLSVTESIQNQILLQINNKEVYSSWSTYVMSAKSTLVDITALGDQIRPNMSEDIVVSWNKLEKVYVKLYEDIYACESQSDLSTVAVSEVYKEAVELTAQFITALNSGKAIASE